MNVFLKLLILFSFSQGLAFGQAEPDYAVKNIPPDLLINANAVIRLNHIGIEIDSLKEVYTKVHFVITILNDKGDKYADFAESTSKLNLIENVSGCIYDANGDRVKKIKQSDFIELPVSMNAGEFNDAKVKLYKVNYRQYPYTVEYTIETRQNHTFQLPVWSAQENTNCALQSARLTVSTLGDISIKYKAFYFNTPIVQQEDGKKKYRWEIANIHAKKQEPSSAPGLYNTPTVMLAVNEFALDNYKGSTNSWKDFGQFIFELNRGRDHLPDDVVSKIKQMTSKANNDHEKIKILYSYLQHTMRYVSVTYGIGGWQPLDADYLSKNQYGDCKALSNYMMAMLAVVGIRSYPVLITAGTENPHILTTDFVCSQFNHCILCVPFTKDTTWLECTSSDLPANYLSDFTQNRDALMITPQGGVLVHTPAYDTSVNLITRHGFVTCNDDGNLKIILSSTYTGESANDLYHELMHDNDHDKEEYLHSKFQLASYSLDDYKYNRADTTGSMRIEENVALTATGMYTKSGSRSFLLLDIAPIPISIPEQDGDRKNEFYIAEAAAVADTFEVTIPDNSEIEFIPNPVSVSFPFGSYSYSIRRNNSNLTVSCKFTLNSGTYDAGQYGSYIKLLSLAENRSHKKVVLKNKS